MALARNTLESALKAVFAAMRDGSKTDGWMAERTAAAIKEYILAGQVLTADTGAAPAGSYAGTGGGTMAVSEEDLRGAFAETFGNTESNSGLAVRMAADIDAVCGADDTVETVTAGTVTAPNGAVAGFSGKGKGNFSGAKADMETLLNACFGAMDGMSGGGDDYLAAGLATAVDKYLAAGIVSVALQSPLSGSGQGSLS
jgi:hypothetical protein